MHLLISNDQISSPTTMASTHLTATHDHRCPPGGPSSTLECGSDRQCRVQAPVVPARRRCPGDLRDQSRLEKEAAAADLTGAPALPQGSTTNLRQRENPAFRGTPTRHHPRLMLEPAIIQGPGPWTMAKTPTWQDPPASPRQARPPQTATALSPRTAITRMRGRHPWSAARRYPSPAQWPSSPMAYRAITPSDRHTSLRPCRRHQSSTGHLSHPPPAHLSIVHSRAPRSRPWLRTPGRPCRPSQALQSRPRVRVSFPRIFPSDMSRAAAAILPIVVTTTPGRPLPSQTSICGCSRDSA